MYLEHSSVDNLKKYGSKLRTSEPQPESTSSFKKVNALDNLNIFEKIEACL